jgi:hypothetical protein
MQFLQADENGLVGETTYGQEKRGSHDTNNSS